jgi:hypothetical protein
MILGLDGPALSQRERALGLHVRDLSRAPRMARTVAARKRWRGSVASVEVVEDQEARCLTSDMCHSAIPRVSGVPVVLSRDKYNNSRSKGSAYSGLLRLVRIFLALCHLSKRPSR